MFEQDSRYYHIKDLTYKDEQGNEVIYKTRRIIPQPDEVASVVTTTVEQGERLDQITNSTFGKPTLYWKVGDANLAMSLTELEIVGRKLRIPVDGKVRG